MAAEGGLKLLGLTVSPFVIRVRMALQMKGIGYEYMEQDLFTKGRPGAHEGPGAHPRRQTHLRVAGHRAVRRRGLGGHGPLDPPRRPLRPRRRSLLGRLRRQQGACAVGRHHVGGDGGGEGGESRRHARGYGPVGGGVRQVLEGKGLLRRRFRRVPRSRRRLAVALVRGAAEDVRRRGHRGRQSSTLGRVGGAVWGD
uniref:GST N-terminal domain-containing protein n=1 Tax=Aegilops tauschii subsp. strangulata TaxID=200361 RepID=A0A452YP23_AEGTS